MVRGLAAILCAAAIVAAAGFYAAFPVPVRAWPFVGEVVAPGPCETAIFSEVAEVREGAPPLVLLRAGRLAGIRRGDHLTIYRGNEFVGKVVVEVSRLRRAGARVLFTAPGKKVRAGDSAATRID